MNQFQLHSQLAADTICLGEFPLSLLLLSMDANYPWFILVPKRADIREIIDLDVTDRQQLFHESCVLSEAIMKVFDAEKLNVAALGNMVPQLHLHHIARYSNDPAWPAPVWGAVEAIPYDEDLLRQRQQDICQALAGAEFQVR